MNLRTLRWSILAVIALTLAATFAAMQFREASRSLVRVEAPQVLGRSPEFELVERAGRSISSRQLAGEPWVADFIFTRCALACPRLTSIMLRLSAEVPWVRRVSFSVDPAHDTPEVLADYARAYGIDDPDWLFLTGEPAEVRRVVIDGFKLPIIETGAGEEVSGSETPQAPRTVEASQAVVHSDRFVLVDAAGAIRGYYRVTEPGEYEKLVRDLTALAEEGVSAAPREEPGLISEPAVRSEIEELHAFFEAWFRGDVPATDEVFARFADVMGEGFSIIGPEGRELGREAILDAVRSSHGSRRGSDFAIWIENVEPRECRADRCLATYEEWQRLDGEARGRVSTGLFAARSGAPNGLVWLHVQETWLPGDTMPQGEAPVSGAEGEEEAGA